MLPSSTVVNPPYKCSQPIALGIARTSTEPHDFLLGLRFPQRRLFSRFRCLVLVLQEPRSLRSPAAPPSSVSGFLPRANSRQSLLRWKKDIFGSFSVLKCDLDLLILRDEIGSFGIVDDDLGNLNQELLVFCQLLTY